MLDCIRYVRWKMGSNRLREQYRRKLLIEQKQICQQSVENSNRLWYIMLQMNI